MIGSLARGPVFEGLEPLPEVCVIYQPAQSGEAGVKLQIPGRQMV